MPNVWNAWCVTLRQYQDLNAERMILKSLLTAVVLSTGILLLANFVLGPTKKIVTNSAREQVSTLMIAPFSLGNTAAAATLVTRLPEDSFNYRTPTQDINYKFSVQASRGETLSDILNRTGVSGKDRASIIRSLKKVFKPSRLRQGQTVNVTFKTNPEVLSDTRYASPGDFLKLSLLPDFAHIIVVEKNDDDEFSSSHEQRQLTTRLVRASNTINQSLFMAGKKVKVPSSVLSELIRLYSWDVDFQRDIRSGDGFKLMYEQYFDAQGKLVHSGNVIYASLELSGKGHAIYRHTIANGDIDYFDEKGQSTKKELMRTPIDGARLSSGFGRRKHPVLGYNKMHKGLDFAAPHGTPIYAAGNGTIKYAGRKGAYGNFVLIRHNATYSTAYAHMKRINTAKGRRVKQGQVIGYVGTTGRSTGPHLHYEIRRSGRQVNPLKVKLPAGRKLVGQELISFQSIREKIEAQYAGQGQPVNLASH
jgi:murein DD-endopeptidase MepM/ murein hydrolase activator NlpD